jgi:uncharacterized protein YndB with AHSA1/START domain
MTSRTASANTIVQEIMIDASPDKIFDALTVPEHLLEWWYIEDQFHLIRALCDVRPGGKWTMRVASDSGEEGESIVHGVYRTVLRPNLLEYTWIREEPDHPETVVRWELQKFGASTRVRVTHSGLSTQRLRERNSGWLFIVQLLKDYLES